MFLETNKGILVFTSNFLSLLMPNLNDEGLIDTILSNWIVNCAK